MSFHILISFFLLFIFLIFVFILISFCFYFNIFVCCYPTSKENASVGHLFGIKLFMSNNGLCPKSQTIQQILVVLMTNTSYSVVSLMRARLYMTACFQRQHLVRQRGPKLKMNKTEKLYKNIKIYHNKV